MTKGALALISGKDMLGEVGGHHSYVRAHALAAGRAGFEPHIFCLSGRRDSVSVLTEFGVVHDVGVRNRPPAAFQGPLLGAPVARFLERRPGPHVIHSFAIWAAAGVLASRALARRGVTAIPVASAYTTRSSSIEAMVAGAGPQHGLRNRLHYRAWRPWTRHVDDRVERWGYARSGVVLVNYHSVRDLLLAAYGPRLAIRLLPYSSPEAFADASGAPATPVPAPIAALGAPQLPLVLAISRHDPRKGLDVLLRALARLAAAGVDFRACIAGPGRLLDAHRELASTLGLGDRVAIPGRVEDVRPYLDRADVFVLPSLSESSGSVSVLEALGAGVAVVASGCDGIPEDLVDGHDALLVAPGDVGALAAALTRALAEPQHRERLAANGRDTYAQRFSADRFASALGDLYAELGAGVSGTAEAARTAAAT